MNCLWCGKGDDGKSSRMPMCNRHAYKRQAIVDFCNHYKADNINAVKVLKNRAITIVEQTITDCENPKHIPLARLQIGQFFMFRNKLCIKLGEDVEKITYRYVTTEILDCNRREYVPIRDAYARLVTPVLINHIEGDTT